MSNQAVPGFRTYRHLQCGGETLASGESFEVVSNPLSGVEVTQCSACGAQSPIADFVWADTEESIADYYARHGQSASDFQRLLCSRRFMLTLIAIGALIVAAGCFYLVRDDNWLAQVLCTGTGLVIGAVVGGTAFEKVFEKPIARKVCGVRDTRMLN